MSNIGILGAGAFGTALAILSHSQNHRVRVWSFEKNLPENIVKDKENAAYLPGFQIPPEIVFHNDLSFVLHETDLVLIVTPAQFVRSVTETAGRYIPKKALVGCCSKGIEHGSLMLMSEVLAETMPDSIKRHTFLSGPTFAKEIAGNMPMDIAVCSSDIKVARRIQKILHSPTFRIYAGNDPVGIEVAGALKNVMAIACGASDQMGMGTSARASLISRGLAELTRMGVALGANPVTFLGLAGVGDLVLTCTGDLSRNRTLGKLIADGQKAKDILASRKSVAEGYYTAKPARELALREGVDAPIIEQVYYVLYEDRPLIEAVRLLMTRSPKDEFAGIQ